MAKPKAKHAKKAHRFKLRNARSPSASSRPAAADKETHNKKELTGGQATLYSAGGGAAAAVICALLSRYNVLPATFATGILTAVGVSAAAVATDPKLKATGQGVMAAAGAQLGLVLLDNHYKENVVRTTLAETKPDPRKPANAESLPPGALEAAYERARRRLAMAEAAGQMAA